MKNLKYFLPAFIILAAVCGVVAAHASITTSTGTVTPYSYQTFTFLSATSTTATSTNITGGGGYFITKGARAVTLYFQRGDTSGQGNTGTTTFKVQVTPDGTNWYDYNTLVPNLPTSTTPTSVSSVILSAAANYNTATSTQVYYMAPFQSFFGIRCIAVEQVDGEHTCKASATF